MEKLKLDDIVELREYERVRDQYLSEMMTLKKLRRIFLGPHISILFENRDTIKFQIQEMARAEKLTSDKDIQSELEAYNPLIPGSGELCATLFIELTNEMELREWLPKLVGIERSIVISIDGCDQTIISAEEESQEEMLTRSDTTPSVHYIKFSLSNEQISAFLKSKVIISSIHENYSYECVLSDTQLESIRSDLAS